MWTQATGNTWIFCVKVWQFPKNDPDYNMIFKLIISILQLSLIESTVFTVNPSDPTINAVTSYAWSITFSPTSSRTSITFTFPSATTVSSNSTIIYNSSSITVSSFTSNTISFSASSVITTSNVTIIVTNIVNPTSAITSTTDFSITSDF